MGYGTLLLAIAIAGAAALPAAGQGAERLRERSGHEGRRGEDRAGIERGPRAFRMMRDGYGDDRAVIGVSTSSSGKRDTLGLLVVSIVSGSPAEKAGVEEGNRIQAVNGVSLRLSVADAGERDMNGLTSRRLQRELEKSKAGEEVELTLYADGRTRKTKVKTVAGSDLRDAHRESFRRWEDRAVLGLGLGGGGSKRDTLGVLVISVTPDGPAEKAGIVEGTRIQAINGVSLRVAAEDAGDGWMSGIRSSRFQREMRKLSPGDKVELSVFGDGRTRSTSVTAVKASDLFKERGGTGRGMFMFGEGDMGGAMLPMPPMPPWGGMIQDEIDHALEGLDHLRHSGADFRSAHTRVWTPIQWHGVHWRPSINATLATVPRPMEIGMESLLRPAPIDFYDGGPGEMDEADDRAEPELR
ncbi:MAG: hypothetical protein NVS4B3_17350 [Gemmatimonadaceae bacterium]